MADSLYPITVPKWGIEMQEGTITGWRVSVGSAVSKGDELIDIETEKIVNTMEAPAGGVVRRQLAEEGETLRVGELLGVIAVGDANDADIDAFIRDFVPAEAGFGIDDAEIAEPAPRAASAGATPSPGVRVSPVARRLAEKLGVDLGAIKGTGRNGRISKDDVEAAAGGSRAADEDVVPLSTRRRTIARRLVTAKQAIPHYYLTRTVNVQNALVLKAQAAGAVSLNAILLKAVAGALMEHPRLNCHVLDSGIRYRSGIDINMAVDTDQGLSAPLIRNVDRLTFRELTDSAAELAQRAKHNRLAREDLDPGGFTVSNLGALDIESFTAIINPPQAAILAIGTVGEYPAFRGGELVAEQRLKVTLSCDHRVIDGADGARFLKTLAACLDNIEA